MEFSKYEINGSNKRPLEQNSPEKNNKKFKFPFVNQLPQNDQPGLSKETILQQRQALPVFKSRAKYEKLGLSLLEAYYVLCFAES